MKIATLNRGKESKYLNQYPLVDEDDIYNNDHLKEGDLFYLMNGQEQYIATAYVGRQHKGLGWVLSYDQNEAINTSFSKNNFKLHYKSVIITIILKEPMRLDYLTLKAMVLEV